MTETLITIAMLYVVAGLLVGLIAYVGVNPYGDISKWSQCLQAVLAGVFWLPMFFWVMGCLIYEWFSE